MALAGVGVDILEIARMERALERTPRVAERAFTRQEREYCERAARPAERYAARWAARGLLCVMPGPDSAGFRRGTPDTAAQSGNAASSRTASSITSTDTAAAAAWLSAAAVPGSSVRSTGIVRSAADTIHNVAGQSEYPSSINTST